MKKDTLEEAVQRFMRWHKQQREIQKPTTRLERHEAMKAILFGFYQDNPRLESTIPYTYVTTKGIKQSKSGKLDYLDDRMAVEIDDGPNRKSIFKLSEARKEGLDIYWILLLRRGKGGKALRNARENNIPYVRVFCRNNTEYSDWG